MRHRISRMLGLWGAALTWVLVSMCSKELPEQPPVEPINTPPIEDAGVDQRTFTGALVTLDGSGSRDLDGDVLTFRWRQTCGAQVALFGDTTASPAFTPVEAGMYVFSLVVNDGKEDSEPGTVKVMVQEADRGVLAGEMVLIPSGSFQMGDVFNEGDEDERPVHTVYVDAFYMDVVEVTNAQYKAFCDATGQAYPKSQGKEWYNRLPPNYVIDYSNFPVTYLYFSDRVRYCNWRSREEGLEECYNETSLWPWECDFTKNGYRLPTEAEWEYAARGGLEGRRYPWGDEDPCGRANVDNEADFHPDAIPFVLGVKYRKIGPTPVGSYAPNGYGLYDMAGNVWEWCNDWYDKSYYASSPASNPTGPRTGTYRVMRGGSWGYLGLQAIRCASRGNLLGDLYSHIGFRCVRRAP